MNANVTRTFNTILEASNPHTSCTSLLLEHAALIGDHLEAAQELCAQRAYAAGAFCSVSGFKLWFERHWLDTPCSLHFHAALGHETWMNTPTSENATMPTPCALARTALALLKATLLRDARTDQEKWRLWYQCPEMSYHSKAVAHLLQQATSTEKAALRAQWTPKMSIKRVLSMYTDVLGHDKMCNALRPPSDTENTALRRLDVEGLEAATKTTLRSPAYWRKYEEMSPEQARQEFVFVYNKAWPENLEEAQDHALRHWKYTRACDALQMALKRRELHAAEKTYRLAQQVALRYLGLRMPPSPVRPVRKKQRPAAPDRTINATKLSAASSRRSSTLKLRAAGGACGSPVRPAVHNDVTRAQA